MDAPAGWIVTARDLTRLLVAVDAFETKPDLLDPDTIETMMTPSLNNHHYALGWQVNSEETWYHFGAMMGTAAFVARNADGYTWAIIVNGTGPFGADWNDLPKDCIAATTSYPAHDLMAVPTRNASGVSFSDVTQDSVTVSWNPGNGDQRLLVGSKNEPVSAFPLDGVSYGASPVWGLGSDLGGENYVLSAGSGNSVTVTGLESETPYFFRVFELNQNVETGGYPLYMLCNSDSTGLNALAPGEVAHSLTVEKSTETPGDLTLSWDPSCSASAEDYGIYEGTLLQWSSHTSIDCSDDGGDRTEEVTPAEGDRYYLVVPHGAAAEGSYGRGSNDLERPGGGPASCRSTREIYPCPSDDCLPLDTPCVVDADCCSDKCNGPSGNETCR
jgi:hypothetical protein